MKNGRNAMPRRPPQLGGIEQILEGAGLGRCCLMMVLEGRRCRSFLKEGWCRGAAATQDGAYAASSSPECFPCVVCQPKSRVQLCGPTGSEYR